MNKPSSELSRIRLWRLARFSELTRKSTAGKTQKGFAHLEALLIVVILAVIAFTGYYVWHSRSQANKSLANAANTNQTALSEQKQKNSTLNPTSKDKKSSTATSLINYTGSDSQTGVELSSASDADKLEGASDSFKDFIKNKFKEHGNSPSPCGNAYGLFVKKIYKDQFALGGEGDCGGAEKLWAKISSQWQEIGGTQQGFDCSLLEQYKVPSAIVEHCLKNGQETINTQE